MEAAIYCPKCKWEPDGQPYWQCHCGHLWNTFETAAKCPSCGFQHKKTQCVSCEVLSDHIDWYHYPISMDELVENLEKESVEKH